MKHVDDRTPARTQPGGRFLENLAYLVPGYRGYKDKELRREEDARLRSRVLGRLREIGAILEQRLEKLAEGALDPAADTLDRKLRRLEGLADAVRYAPYGFAGFFDANQVKETTLEHILEADLLLFQDLDDFSESVRGAPFPPKTREGFTDFFHLVENGIERIETRLVQRDKLLGDC